MAKFEITQFDLAVQTFGKSVDILLEKANVAIQCDAVEAVGGLWSSETEGIDLADSGGGGVSKGASDREQQDEDDEPDDTEDG